MNSKAAGGERRPLGSQRSLWLAYEVVSDGADTKVIFIIFFIIITCIGIWKATLLLAHPFLGPSRGLPTSSI